MSNRAVPGAPNSAIIVKSNQIENSLVDAVAPGILESVVDVGEFALDSMLEQGLLEEIPVMSWMVRLYRAGAGVKDVLFLKKLNLFLGELQTVNERERKQFIDSMNADPEQKQRVGETLLILLERLDDMEKPRLVARAFKRFMRQDIDLEMLRRVCLAIDRCFLPDLRRLAIPGQDKHLEQAAALVLTSCGLVEVAAVPAVRGPGERNKYTITDFGKRFVAIVLRE